MYVASTKETSAANAIFLQYTAPIYVALIGPFILSERLRSREALPFVICIAGIAVLFLGNSGSGEMKGLLLGAGSGFFYGMFFIWLRRLRYADAIAITLINCLGVVVLLVAVPSVWHVDARDIGLLVIMAAVQFALPYVLFTRGVAHVPVAEASLIALIEPVLSPGHRWRSSAAALRRDGSRRQMIIGRAHRPLHGAAAAGAGAGGGCCGAGGRPGHAGSVSSRPIMGRHQRRFSSSMMSRRSSPPCGTTWSARATASSRPATAKRPSRSARRAHARPHRARPDAARDRRPRGLPHPAPRDATCRSSCSRRAPTRSTRSSAWRSAPTTT